MKKHMLILLSVLLFTILTGCVQQEGAEDHTIKGNTPDNMNNAISEERQQSQYGYVRYNENQLDQEREQNITPKIDREKMANMITRTILKLENVEEAATLITDQHTFIAYTAKDNTDREQVALNVKETALSFLPRWYNVYVSDNSTAFTELRSLSNDATTEQGDQQAIEQLIKQFRHETPQPGDAELESQEFNQ